jgi:signal transduction histidine kinase
MPDKDLVIQALSALVLVVAGALSATLWAVARSKRQLGETMRAASTIVSSALTAADSYRGMDGMAEQLAELFDAEGCVVALPTGDGSLFCGPSFGYPNPEELVIGEGEGICGYVYSTGEPLLVADVRKEPRFIEQIPGIKYAIAVPLRFEGKVLGSFELESRRRRYRQTDFDVLTPLADQIAAVMANTRLRHEAEARANEESTARKELQAVSAVVMAGVASSEDLDGALQSMIQEISGRLGWESMAVVLFGDDGALHTRAYYGYPIHSTLVPFPPGVGVIGSVAAKAEGRIIDDVRSDPDYLDLVSDTQSEMCVPLKVGEQVLGVLNAESPRKAAFSEADFRLLGTLARQMALVIERARIFDIEREALERMREADRLKDDFVATVSHELRTPLTSIKGYAKTLLARAEHLSADERESFLEVMVRQSDRLATIVDRLLLVSRLESGDVGEKPTYVPVAGLIRDAIESACGEGRVEIETNGGLGLVTDRFRLHHTMRNLIENACKYSPSEAPVLVRVAERGSVIDFEVIDQGSGIPEGQEEVVFERFQRLSDPGYATVPGTGLGLYISRRFARDLGGDLVVGESLGAPWTGARFVLTLPVGALPDPRSTATAKAQPN